jgi:hypothetical protein
VRRRLAGPSISPQSSNVAARRYGDEVDVKRAADLYSQGWTQRQIGAELGVPWTTVSEHLRRAGVTMRRGGASAHPASTQQILELRDQGLTWPEIAEQVDMTVSEPLPPSQAAQVPNAWADGSRCSPTPLTRTSRSASGQPSLIISASPHPG